MTTVLEALNQALFAAMQANESVYLIGEDLLDPYGGAFKVSKGLSSKYPERVLTSPVSEAGIVGIAGGMALRGLRPVVEIMFGDFTTLIADQLINNISKFRWMYNDQVSVRLLFPGLHGNSDAVRNLFAGELEQFFCCYFLCISEAANDTCGFLWKLDLHEELDQYLAELRIAGSFFIGALDLLAQRACPPAVDFEDLE